MRIIITVRSAEDGSEKCRMQNACGCDRGSAFLALWEENLCFVAETTELFLEMYYNAVSLADREVCCEGIWKN